MTEQKYSLAKRLTVLTQEHIEEQLGVWEQEGYDRRELYHIMHREFIKLYKTHVRDYDVNEIEKKEKRKQ